MPSASTGSRRRPSRPLLSAVVALALTVAACRDGGDAEDQVVGEPGASTTSTSDGTSSTTTTTAAEATTSSAAPATTTTVPFDGGTDPVTIPRPDTTEDVVAHTGLEVGAAGGEERITFRFDGALPGIDVRYVERPVRAAGSGDEVEVAGDAVLAIRFEPASSARFDGEDVVRTYDGPDRVAGSATVAEVVRTGDFEAVYEWAAGVTPQVPFRVEVDAAAATVTVVVPAG